MTQPIVPGGGGTTAIRGPVLTFSGDPFNEDLSDVLTFEPDAVIAMAGGKITEFGPARRVLAQLPPGTPVTRYKDCVITAGFLDCHVHYPQTQIIAAHGEQLIDWLNRYAFVAEQQFVNPAHAHAVARVFLRECLRNGITTCCVYCTVHPQSVDAFFEEAEALGMRVIAGKVIMDRNAPPPLLDTPRKAYEQSKALIAKWHGRGRLLYAITPRFAPTSTQGQMEAARALRREHPDVFLQTHVSENRGEVAWVKELFPERLGYLDVYDHYGLIGPRTMLGHGVHLAEDELQRVHDAGAAVAHCPTSNEFLGSGLFDLGNAKRTERPVRVGCATDLGAGTTFSILSTLGRAYETAQLKDFTLSAYQAYYLATRGTAHALYLEDRIGSIARGMEADVIVIDLHSTPIIRFRMKYARDLEEALFVQMMMGDDRAIRATYVGGRLAYSRPELPEEEPA
jgi:guanine deaminase